MQVMLPITLLLALASQTPTGAVAGRIVSADGMPAANVRITAVAVAENAAEVRETAMVSITQTDADGRYRLEGVPLGRYVIMAGTYERPAYFPGVALVTDATVVSLSGRNVVEGLNFHLGVRVSGLVSDRDNTVALQTGGYRLLTYVKLDGSFSFPAVLSGTYMMYVNAVPRGRIVVGSTDMEVKDALLMPLDPQLLPGEFVKVPAGEFRMVCVNGDGAACRDFTPPLTTVKEFEIGKREVTQLQWELLMGEFAPIPRRANSNPDDLRGADRPVIGAALSGAHEYCGRLTARNDGYRYRLPTEVEYEYAGRAGGNGPYAAGPDIETRDDSARWNEMYRNRPTEPNALGLYDMTMWEWVGDPAPRGLIRGGSSRKAVGEGGSIIMPFRCVREPVRP